MELILYIVCFCLWVLIAVQQAEIKRVNTLNKIYKKVINERDKRD